MSATSDEVERRIRDLREKLDAAGVKLSDDEFFAAVKIECEDLREAILRECLDELVVTVDEEGRANGTWLALDATRRVFTEHATPEQRAEAMRYRELRRSLDDPCASGRAN